MVIVLCSEMDRKIERDMARLLEEFGSVISIDTGVALAYYLQEQKPCDLVVVAADGAGGMNACSFARGQNKKVPLVWVSDDSDFEQQARRIPVNLFLVKPVDEKRLKEWLSNFNDKQRNVMKQAAHASRDGPDGEAFDALALVDFVVTFGNAIANGSRRLNDIEQSNLNRRMKNG